jgi:rhamnose transport system ATP-binding protein
MHGAVLLEARSIWKSFAGVKALRNVSFELLQGEVHALVGENGAGKSTLIKTISGALHPDAGTLAVCGQAVTRHNPRIARSLGIAVIYQQPALFPHLSVAENIGIALEGGRLWRKVAWRDRLRSAQELLDRVAARIDPERLVETLSMPEQQMVEIAKAVGANAKVLIMDEPTASLTDREVDRLFDVIRSMRSEGIGIIYISHRLEEISTIADRVTVLRDGETIATRPMQGIERAELVRLMVGRELSAVFPKRAVPIGGVVLEVRNLSSEEAGVRNLSLTVRSGEILGIAGLVGSGRTEFAEVLFGLRPVTSGSILLRNEPNSIASPADAIRLGIAYLPEDRRRHGVILQMPVAANTTLASLRALSRNGLIDDSRERDVTTAYIERLRIKAASLYAETGSLSGGNQQKVALARWLATKPRVLVLDEPTQGVDVGSKSEIHRLMVDLAEQGLAIIMISSELTEILGMSDRIAVMHEGAISGILSREEASAQAVLSLALGHAASERLH